MKKMYSEPQTKEILLETENAILVGSGDVDGEFTPPEYMPNPAPGRAVSKVKVF